MRLLDTDILIDLLRKQPDAIAWFGGLTGAIGVPGFAAMELYQGCRNKGEVEDVDRLLAPLDILWATEADCRRALGFFPSCRLSHSLGLLDALIATTALGLGATLCTSNPKHFASVPGLNTERPSSP